MSAAGPPGFLEKQISVRSSNGRDDTLLDPLHFRSPSGVLYRVPAGSTTDGMSTPAIIHPLPGFEPFGRHWFSAVLHDAAYRGTLQHFRWTNYQSAALTRAQADALFLQALASQGVGSIRRHLIHTALRLFGAAAYRRHP